MDCQSSAKIEGALQMVWSWLTLNSAIVGLEVATDIM